MMGDFNADLDIAEASWLTDRVVGGTLALYFHNRMRPASSPWAQSSPTATAVLP
ncbi:MAG: hypothetical protein M3R09_07700 [Actinomycetota bacterium]|nr:hypothetical protein [Actinomycetota bacterium]